MITSTCTCSPSHCCLAADWRYVCPKSEATLLLSTMANRFPTFFALSPVKKKKKKYSLLFTLIFWGVFFPLLHTASNNENITQNVYIINLFSYIISPPHWVSRAMTWHPGEEKICQPESSHWTTCKYNYVRAKIWAGQQCEQRLSLCSFSFFLAFFFLVLASDKRHKVVSRICSEICCFSENESLERLAKVAKLAT